MKRQIRILAIDDAPFTFTDKYTDVIGVVMRGGEYLECVLRSQIEIDGLNATTVCKEMINKSKHRQQLKAVLLDGIAMGGFNIINIDELFTAVHIPIITVTRDKPDFNKMKHALQKNFGNWEDRWELISKGELHQVQTRYNPLSIQYIGVSLEEAKEIITLSTIRGVLPEPLRVAHLIASGITKGESYGKA